MGEIVRVGEGGLIQSMADAERAATAMAQSGFFQDAKQAAQAIVKILAGQEMGFGPFAAMTGIHIIQGRPAIGANLMAAAVKRSGRYNYRVTEMTDDRCAITFYEDGRPIGESAFTATDAKKAQTKNLDKFARNMLFARAMSNGVRWYCPDVFNAPTYTPEELGANVDGDGRVVDAPPVHEVEAEIVEAAIQDEAAEAMYPEAMERNAPAPTEAKPQRPYTPFVLHDLITLSVERRRKSGEALGPKLDNFKRAVVGNIESCFEQHADQARHLVVGYLLGSDDKASSKAWDDAETMALHRWMNATEQDGAWTVDPLACQEAHSVLAEAMACKGQMGLFGEAGPERPF